MRVSPGFVYYGETNTGRLLAVVVTERAGKIRVVTAYDLDAGQRRDYVRRRVEGSPGRSPWKRENGRCLASKAKALRRIGGPAQTDVPT